MEEFSLSIEEKELLLSLAREGISAAVCGVREVDEVLAGRSLDNPRLNRKMGVFVTLKEEGALRGCIGVIHPEEPLYRTVIEAAISSAVRDPRFFPLTEEEIGSTTIEISVLSQFRRVYDEEDIHVGEHGLLLRNGLNAGLLLPQVATEYGWNREEFLEQCCRKAGMGPGCWRENGTEIMIFSAWVFGEKDDE